MGILRTLHTVWRTIRPSRARHARPVRYDPGRVAVYRSKHSREDATEATVPLVRPQAWAREQPVNQRV